MNGPSRPREAAARARVQKRKYKCKIVSSTSRPPLSRHRLARRLARLQHLRRDADAWRIAGAHGRPPQPLAYGLRLGELGSSEIYWP